MSTMAIALIITDQDRDRAKEIKAYAEKNVISSEDLVHMTAKRKKSPGDLPEFTMRCQRGFKIVYSQEMQPTYGLCHHLSVSVYAPDRYPTPEAVQMIMEMFDMGQGNLIAIARGEAKPSNTDILKVWPDKETQSIQVVAKVQGNDQNKPA
jgi:hypothetical protein